MFLSRNRKNNVYPCKPQFYYIKVGLRGSKLYRRFFVMAEGPDMLTMRLIRTNVQKACFVIFFILFISGTCSFVFENRILFQRKLKFMATKKLSYTV